MKDKTKNFIKHLGSFGAGFLVGRKSVETASLFKNGINVDRLLVSYEHDLTPEEIDEIKQCFKDPEIVTAFNEFFNDADKQTKAVWSKAQKKIDEIKSINSEIASQLKVIDSAIIQKRRRTLFSYFIIKSKKEQIIALLNEINRQYKRGEKYWHAVCEKFEFFSPTQAEDIAYGIFKLLNRKETDEAVTLNVLLTKIGKMDVSNSFLGWLRKNHTNKWNQFFQKTNKRYKSDEALVLKVLASAMDLKSHEERLQFLELQGLI